MPQWFYCPEGVSNSRSEAALCSDSALTGVEWRRAPHVRTPGTGRCGHPGATVGDQLRAHLLRIHLLLDERLYQLLPVLVHHLLALVRNGAGQVAAHKLDLPLHHVNGGRVPKPLVNYTYGKLTHLTGDLGLDEGSLDRHHHKVHGGDQVAADLMVHTQAQLSADHIWREVMDNQVHQLLCVLGDQLDASLVHRDG